MNNRQFHLGVEKLSKTKFPQMDSVETFEGLTEGQPDQIRAYFDPVNYPERIREVTLDLKAFSPTDEYNYHYMEKWSRGETWELRVDRCLSQDHNQDRHLHPPPDCPPGEGAIDLPVDFPEDPRDALGETIAAVDYRRRDAWAQTTPPEEYVFAPGRFGLY